MIRKILSVALAVAATGSAFAFGPKRVIPQSDTFKFAPFELNAQQKTTTRADGDEQSIDFTLADEAYTSTAFNSMSVGTEIYEAFRVSEDNATRFKGDKITSINITTGAVVIGQTAYANKVTDVTVFITEDLEKEPVYTQSGTLGTDILTEYKVPLDTPYLIEEGKAFYVGFSFAIPDANQMYITIDGWPMKSEDICWVGYAQNGKVVWQNFAEDVGALCIGCTITGENMPQDGASIMDLSGALYAEPGAEFSYQFLLQGNGVVTENVEFTYSVGSSEPQTRTVTLEEPIGFNKYAVVVLDGLVCNEESLTVPLNFEITKVNGVENSSSINKAKATMNCFEASKGSPRVHLIEEGTGTSCSYCPLGIVMMEYVGEKYSDFFARVAIHGNIPKKDPMTVPSTSSWINTYAKGFPCGFIDRTFDIESLQYANLEMMYNEIDQYVEVYKDVPGAAGFPELNYSFDEDGNLVVDTKVKFAVDTQNDNRYRLAYYLTQDNVGPYTQTNGYAGNRMGPMAGWEKKGTTVSMMYNEVCRLLVGGVRGILESLPTEISAGEVYTYTATIPVTAVTSGDFFLTAFIVDNFTEEIINSKQIAVTNPNYSGVSEVKGESDLVARKFYNISGVEVKEPSNGIYIVRSVYSDGTVKTTKSVVK